MWGGRLRLTVAMMFAIGLVVLFTIGGLSGVTHAVAPSDTQQTDTYYIVAHFHYVLFGGAVFGLFAGFYYWWPKVFGRMLSETLGKINFWLMRISGLVLVVLALGHFALTHIINDVTDTNANFVADRWQNPLWRTYDWALLTLALFHGLNGLRVITEDYVRSPGKRAAVKAVLYVVASTLFVYGTITIITF